MPRPLCKEQADGTDAAVDVCHRFGGLRSQQLQGGAVELLGLYGVHLQEGPGTHLKIEAAEGLPQGGLSGKQGEAAAEDHVGVPVVPVPVDAGREGQGVDQIFRMGQFAPGDDHGHKLPRFGDPGHGVPEAPLPRPLVIRFDMKFVRPSLDRGHGAAYLLLLNAAVLHGHQPVAPGRIEPEGRALLRHAVGEGALIAVAFRSVHADDGPQGHLAKAAQPRQGVRHLALLDAQLLCVGHVAEDAAAAFVIYGAEGLHSMGRWLDHLQELAHRIGRGHLDDVDAYPLPSQSTGHE